MRPDREPRDIGRREVVAAFLASVVSAAALRRIPKGLLPQEDASAFSPLTGEFVLLDKLAVVGDTLFDNSYTTIVPINGERLLRTTESIVVDFSGQNYDVDDNIEALPALDPLGLPMKVKLGNKGDPVSETISAIKDLRNTAKELKRMSVVVDSDSWPLAARVIMGVSDEIDTELVVLLSTPENIGNIKGLLGFLAKKYVSSGEGPSAALNGIVDAGQFHDPFAQYNNPQAASATESYGEIDREASSDRTTQDFAKFWMRYNATHAEPMRILYCLLQDPSKDPLVDEAQSVEDFTRRKLPVDVVLIDGTHQGHDNPTENDKINEALGNYLAKHMIVRGRK